MNSKTHKGFSADHMEDFLDEINLNDDEESLPKTSQVQSDFPLLAPPPPPKQTEISLKPAGVCKSEEHTQDDFGDFHSSFVSSIDSLQKDEPYAANDEFKSFILPPLSAILNGEQKMALAALCLLTFTELKKRYEPFEFIDPTGSIHPILHAEGHVRSRSAMTGFFKRKTVEDQHLLSQDSEEDHEFGSEVNENVGRNSLDSSTAPIPNTKNQSAQLESSRSDSNSDITSYTSSKEDAANDGYTTTELASQSSLQQSKESFRGSLDALVSKDRKAFAELLAIPEGIEDILHLRHHIDGNIALCYAIKTIDQWSHSIMERLYKELNISLQGLVPSDLSKCLIPSPKREETENEDVKFSLPPGPFPCRRLSLGDLLDGADPTSLCGDDVRPLMLWNLFIIILSNEKDYYDARARVFLKRIAVDHLNYGSWIDFMEDIEVPLTETALQSDNETTLKALENDSSEFLNATQLPLHHSVNTTAFSLKTKDISKLHPTLSDISVKKGDMFLKHGEKEKFEKKESTKRKFLMAAAAVGGGIIIGVSAGLAAPMLGAGIGAALTAIKIAGTTSFLGGVGGTALITSGGVLTGANVAGSKMSKRMKGVEVFRFIPLHDGKERNNVIISISGWVTSKKNRKMMPGYKSATGEKSTPPAPTKENSVDNSSKDKDEDHDHESLLATGLDDIIIPFMGILPIMGSHYALCFDPHILCSLGDALKLLTSEIISFSANQILQQTILSTVMAALNWPMWLLKLGYLVDNPWSLGLDRARKSGLILAEALCNNVQNGRPVSLVGFSLGARVIWYCLVELAKRGKYGIIEDVYMFGAPILVPRVVATAPKKTFMTDSKASADSGSAQSMQSLDEWRQAISVVSGCLYNCFSRADWILGFLFRGSVAGLYDVAGLGPVILDAEVTPDVINIPLDELAPDEEDKNAPDPAYKSLASEDEEKRRKERPTVVQNVDITELVPGHIYYRDSMPMLIKRVCKFGCWSDNIDVIEEAVAGEWMEEIDGWWRSEKDRLKMKKKRQRRRTNSANKSGGLHVDTGDSTLSSTLPSAQSGSSVNGL